MIWLFIFGYMLPATVAWFQARSDAKNGHVISLGETILSFTPVINLFSLSFAIINHLPDGVYVFLDKIANIGNKVNMNWLFGVREPKDDQ